MRYRDVLRPSGYGEELLKACEDRARSLRIRKLFALTTRAAHWFLEQGFRAAGVDASYVEIDSDFGHLASGADCARWAAALRGFLDGLGR